MYAQQQDKMDQIVPAIFEAGNGIGQYWQSQKEVVHFFDVEKDTTEFRDIETNLKKSLPRSLLTQVTRVQNTWTWDRYAFERKRLELKNDGIINELNLYHGTSGTNPFTICAGQEGLDVRYSKPKRSWGQGNYFTACANYAHKYAHNSYLGDTTLKSQLLLVKVTLGRVKEFGTNRQTELRMPPALTETITNSLGVASTVFDSVSGITHNTKVYVTYSNHKSYPAYVLTYQPH